MKSTFQSPVWRIVPSAHRKTNPQQSGIECVTLIGSTSKGPATNLLRVLNTLSLDGINIPNSFRRFLISCFEREKKGHGINKYQQFPSNTLCGCILRFRNQNCQIERMIGQIKNLQHNHNINHTNIAWMVKVNRNVNITNLHREGRSKYWCMRIQSWNNLKWAKPVKP